MAEPGNKRISLSHQAALLGINRTSIYRPPRGPVWTEIDLEDLRMIDEIYTAKPFYGYRRITAEMRQHGSTINRKRVRRLMSVMGIAGICPGPNLSKRLHARYNHPAIPLEGTQD